MNFDPEAWRSRPGSIRQRARRRGHSAIGDLFQTHLREFGGGRP